MKQAKPPALGTILFCTWAGCNLTFGLSKRLNLLAIFIVGKNDKEVIRNEKIAGIRNSIMQKLKIFL